MKLVLATITAAALALPISLAFAQPPPPLDPNCLGTDVSGFAQNFRPLGQNVVRGLASDGDGFGNEILAHLQGVPSFSTCPDNGFPSHVP